MFDRLYLRKIWTWILMVAINVLTEYHSHPSQSRWGVSAWTEWWTELLKLSSSGPHGQNCSFLCVILFKYSWCVRVYYRDKKERGQLWLREICKGLFSFYGVKTQMSKFVKHLISCTTYCCPRFYFHNALWLRHFLWGSSWDLIQ